MPLAGKKVLTTDFPDGTLRCIGDCKHIRKGSTQSVTSEVVLQNDADFVFDLPVGTFEIMMWLHVSGAESGDIRVAHNFDGTASVMRSSIGADESMTDRENTNAVLRGNLVGTEQVYGIDATGSTVVHEALTVEVSAAGTWTVQWAQGTSSGTSTDCTTGSRLRVLRLE